MKVEFYSSFNKDLLGIRDPAVLKQIRRLIQRCENAESILKIPNVKKLVGTSNYFRIRIGDYRIGVTFSGKTLSFVRVLHRKEIYRYFP